MGGLLFLAVGVFFGMALCDIVFPRLNSCGNKAFDGKDISMSSLFVRIPAYVLFGLIPLTFFTYFSAYLFKVKGGNQNPLLPANILSLSVFFLLALFLVLWKRKRKMPLTKDHKLVTAEWVLLFFVLFLTSLLMFRTFFVSDGKMYVGLSVFSDFAPHLGMIRSFSFGNNFPTSYSHFAGEDIRYHFMFQFLVGNLEYLGMRIDFAFNLPSIFGLAATCMLLYALAVRLTAKRAVGVLTTIFFLFRSSPSFFKYLAELPKGQVLKSLAEQNSFISYTPHEDWGLWNLNVYCNQRHFAFAIAVLLLTLHFFLPYLYEMAGKLQTLRLSFVCGKGKGTGVLTRFGEYCKTLFFTKEAFAVQHPVQAVVFGLLLGMLAFFNGSVLTAACVILFFMAAFSNRRLDYLITAGLALILSLLEAKFFVQGSAVSPKYQFGFIAEQKTLFGVTDYICALCGVLVFCVLLYLFIGKGVKRYLILPFLTPAIMAFTLSLTVDVTVNHKFVMLSTMLLSVYPAILVTSLFEREGALKAGTLCGRRVVACLLVFFLTITGLFETKIVLQRNQKNSGFIFEMRDPLIQFVHDNMNSDDIILSSYYHIHRVVLGGGMLYYGWPYYAWSAGYDTAYREREVAKMYQAGTVEELKQLISEHHIRFIIVDKDAKENEGYYVREDIIKAAYQPVYSEGEGEWLFTIYDTKKPVSVAE